MTPSQYQEKREAKKERFISLSEKFQSEGEQKVEAGFSRLKNIPFGQPILIGHHSEKGDRAYRGRSVGMIDKGYELQKKADYYEERAERIENNTAISSDDPGAVQKLTAKLTVLENVQKRMKQENATARKQKQPQPFASYQLTNNNANIKTVKQRIESISKLATEARPDIIGEGYSVHEDKEENRIMFIFDGKPEEGKRNILKKYGFKWSPNRMAWVRQLNENGRRAVKWIIEDLTK